MIKFPYFYTSKQALTGKRDVMNAERNAPQWLIILAFLAIYIVWGTTYLAVIYGLKGFPPFMLSGLRYVIAAVLLLGWCLLKRIPWPGWPVVRVCAVSGILMLVGGSGMVAWSEQYVTSGQAAIVIAAEPFVFLLADRKRWREYFGSPFIITGLLVGFAGIVLFFGGGDSTTQPAAGVSMQWIGYGVILIGTIFWAGGALYAEGKLNRQVPNVLSSGIQLLAAAVASNLISVLTGEWAFRCTAGTGGSVGRIIISCFLWFADSLYGIYLAHNSASACTGQHSYLR